MTNKDPKGNEDQDPEVNEDQADEVEPTTPTVGQLVRTEDGRHGLVVEQTEDGPVVAWLTTGTVYQLPLNPVA